MLKFGLISVFSWLTISCLPENPSTSFDSTIEDNPSSSLITATTAETSTTIEDFITSSSSTDEPIKSCGDGIIDIETEECDNSGSDCINCKIDRIIFVTSIPHNADFGGLALADEFCNTLAVKANKEKFNGRTMRAWLSGTGYNAGSRFPLAKGRYIRPDGKIIIQIGTELTSSFIENSISIDEYNIKQDVLVWTNTNSSGKTISSNHCNDWTTDSWFQSSWVGWSSATDFQWTQLSSELNPVLCGTEAHLYCVEQG